MERRLYEASLSGNTQTLNTMIQEDPLLLDRVTVTWFNETPLHIAALRGHLDFSSALLSLKPKLATELDSHGRSPLHLASAEGYTNIARELLRVNTDVCLLRDHEGRIPLHLAAMKGQVEVIDELIRARPDSTWERLDRGETVLHLVVKYNQFSVLKKLMESTSTEDALVSSIDDDRNTILHAAAALKQMETVKYLLHSRRSGVKEQANALNLSGFTALDVLEHYPRDLKGMEIREMLLKFGVRRGNDLKMSQPQPPLMTENPSGETIGQRPCPKVRQLVAKAWKSYVENDNNWLEDTRGNLMVVATVTAAMAFQTGISPPGGLWQDSKDDPDGHQAGTSIVSKAFPKEHKKIVIFNTTSFLASLTIILLMISGFPLKNRASTWVLMVVMSVSVSFMAFTYLYAIQSITPKEIWDNLDGIFDPLFYACSAVFAVFMVIHTARVLSWIVVQRQRIAPCLARLLKM